MFSVILLLAIGCGSILVLSLIVDGIAWAWKDAHTPNDPVVGILLKSLANDQWTYFDVHSGVFRNTTDGGQIQIDLDGKVRRQNTAGTWDDMDLSYWDRCLLVAEVRQICSREEQKRRSRRSAEVSLTIRNSLKG